MEGIHEADAPCPAETATDCGQAPADGLAEPGRRVAEQRTYRALVDRAYGTEPSPTAPDAWAEAVPALRASWEILKERYGHEERAEPAPQADGGSWRGKGGRALDATANAEIDLGYARIREVGENVIVPAILRVAAEDPTRALAGFDCRIKGEDRLKEKICDRMRSKGRIGRGGIGADFRRRAVHIYVRRDLLRRWRAQGPGTTRSRRVHPSRAAQHMGIGPVQGNQHAMAGTESGVRFEVQFHTPASLEAKELTHQAYERIRSITEQTPETDRETAELKQFQRRVNAKVPIPPGVADIEDYRPERR